jgi:hypothetical protein
MRHEADLGEGTLEAQHGHGADHWQRPFEWHCYHAKDKSRHCGPLEAPLQAVGLRSRRQRSRSPNAEESSSGSGRSRTREEPQ